MSDDENYLAALKIIVDQSKSSIAISGAPLALLLTQSRYLLSLEGWFVSSAMTIAIVSLFFAMSGSWLLASHAQATLASETLFKDGGTPKKGRLYYDFIQRLTHQSQHKYTELGFVELSQKLVWPVAVAILIGYISIITLMLYFVWSTPVR